MRTLAQFSKSMQANIVAAAMVARETNRGYCESLGDMSQPAWAQAPMWQRNSAVAGVIHLLDNPDATPEQSHESWMREKEADGWVYGPVKDSVAKTHPCYTAYENLPQDQRAKDYIFRAVVRAYFLTLSEV